MGRPIARIGDATSHGGVILQGSDNTFCNGRRVARLGDLVSCPIPGHGVNPIISGSDNTFANGRRVVRVGDRTACGAVISSGSDNTFCN